MQGELRFCDCRYNPDSTTRLNETHTLDKDCSEIHKMPRDLSRKFTDKPLLPPDRQFFLETAVVLHNYLLGRKVSDFYLFQINLCKSILLKFKMQKSFNLDNFHIAPNDPTTHTLLFNYRKTKYRKQIFGPTKMKIWVRLYFIASQNNLPEPNV